MWMELEKQAGFDLVMTTGRWQCQHKLQVVLLV